jgi:hypothetical protein
VTTKKVMKRNLPFLGLVCGLLFLRLSVRVRSLRPTDYADGEPARLFALTTLLRTDSTMFMLARVLLAFARAFRAGDLTELEHLT